MRLARATVVLGLGLGLAAGTTARASPPTSGPIDAPDSRPLIAHGEPVAACGWPTTVAVTGGVQCTGTLIHPRVVAYAAHCGGSIKTIRFGEDSLAGARSILAQDCAAYPSYAGADDQGHDWAYCVLPDPIAQLPVTPPLFGCELELLEVGDEVAIVGYGETLDMSAGVKHWAATTLAALTPQNNTALVGNPNLNLPSICSGDSGGPLVVQLEDGSWRTVGIASTVTGACGGYGAYALLAGAIAWIEADSGVDVTPCHTADGSWAPGPDCAGMFSQGAGLGSGSWDDWCSGTPASGPSVSCGPAWDGFDPSALPSVEITAPSDGESFDPGAAIDVEVAAIKHPDGHAVARVRLEVDAAELGIDDGDPWRFEDLALDPGVHELVAIAEDWAGNAVDSAVVTIGIGVEVDPDDGGSETDGETDTETDTGPPLDDSDGGGCACAAARERAGSGIGLASLLLVIAVRRRSLKNR